MESSTYYFMVYLCLVIKPFVHWIITDRSWMSKWGFTVAETVVAVLLFCLYKPKPSNEAIFTKYFGVPFPYAQTKLPRRESVNAIMTKAFTRPGPPNQAVAPRSTGTSTSARVPQSPYTLLHALQVPARIRPHHPRLHLNLRGKTRPQLALNHGTIKKKLYPCHPNLTTNLRVDLCLTSGLRIRGQSFGR
jgi:hypothetical protein